MVFEVSVERAVNFVRWSTYPLFTGPLKTTATTFHILIFTILWHLSILNVLCLFFPLLYSIYKLRGDSFIVTSAVCYSTAIAGVTIKCVICRLYRKRIQSSIEEMENFLINTRPHERKLVENHMKRCIDLHLTLIITNYVTPTLILCGFMFGPTDKFVTPAVYPFSVDSGVNYWLVNLHQISVAFQCAAGSGLGTQPALLLWFVGARLKILATELQRVRNHTDLHKIIKKHQRLLRFANDVIGPMSYIAFHNMTGCCIIIVASCLQLVQVNTLANQTQFGPLAVLAMIVVFVPVWSADNLIDACNHIRNAAYNCQWMDMSPEMRKNMLIVLQRAQKPVVVSIGGFIPTLSLRYYGCFVSAVISYFMTLRAIVVVNKP